MAPTFSSAFVTIQKIYYPSLCAVGIPANLLTVYTIHNRKCGMSKVARLYLISLAIVDSMCLFWGGIVDLSLSWLDPNLFWNHSPWCGLVTVMEYGSVFSSIWIVIVFTLERYLVLRSTQARQQCSQTKVTIQIILSVILVSHLIAIPTYWINNSELQNVTLYNQTFQLPICTYSDSFFSTVVVWFHTFISGGIPYMLLIFFNCLIGQQLYRASRMFTREQLKSINGVTTRKLMKKSILILFTVSFTFVLLSLPRFVTYCILRTAYNTPKHNRDDYGQLINVFADIGIMLQWLNSAINFLLYCAVSKQFRSEFFLVLTCRCRNVRTPASQTPLKVYSLQGAWTEASSTIFAQHH
ncbi:probable G-protein coupled receptor 139 [Rhincodon typus]|uniref:probable G-protein coupled receptor 139 n=1 Tax=Rhincodon typus TaxID=259920 RepID=UPI0009A3F7E4|nr:probable G-protein coupled receptor 139 [Rhincodon typus]XP_048453156.1 probable G-protein coupled receptor 139 [Rhincodon typus]XP_048453157.1 probable G-protein coupled receptor 139 [Rhincodon typus]XP_048453158.1 probable G-protein coupled receptor 139 [Rhincodon typus]XP_048453160.1 probable G-protein coupled receptor 139 [Rhincodon typus]